MRLWRARHHRGIARGPGARGPARLAVAHGGQARHPYHRARFRRVLAGAGAGHYALTGIPRGGLLLWPSPKPLLARNGEPLWFGRPCAGRERAATGFPLAAPHRPVGRPALLHHRGRQRRPASRSQSPTTSPAFWTPGTPSSTSFAPAARRRRSPSALTARFCASAAFR